MLTTGSRSLFYLYMNIKTFAEKTGIDYEKVMEDFCGDTAALKERILSFEPDCSIPSLKAAIEEKNEEAVHSIAHRIRKNAEKLTLNEIARLARKLEEADTERFQSLAEPLEKEISAYKTALDS